MPVIHAVITPAPPILWQLLPLLFLLLCRNLLLHRWNCMHLLGLEAYWQMQKNNFESNEGCTITSSVIFLEPLASKLQNVMESQLRIPLTNFTRCQYFQPQHPVRRSQKTPRLCRKLSTESTTKDTWNIFRNLSLLFAIRQSNSSYC